MYSCGHIHMDEQTQDDQLEPTYSSFVPMQDMAWRSAGNNGQKGGVVREGQGYLCW